MALPPARSRQLAVAAFDARSLARPPFCVLGFLSPHGFVRKHVFAMLAQMRIVNAFPSCLQQANLNLMLAILIILAPHVEADKDRKRKEGAGYERERLRPFNVRRWLNPARPGRLLQEVGDAISRRPAHARTRCVIEARGRGPSASGGTSFSRKCMSFRGPRRGPRLYPICNCPICGRVRACQADCATW
jgi:hypothetical protein